MSDSNQPPESGKPPAGYYPDNSGGMRWWDGNGWTERMQGGVATATAPPVPEKKSHTLRNVLLVILALIVLTFVGCVALVGGAVNEADKAISQSSDTGTSEEESEPDMTSGQRNALRSAESYLSTAPFSRKGLIQQLSSDAGDGYAVKDARFAADNVEVSWKQQAAKAAKNYLEISGFSRQGLIQQLSSDAGDGYTRKQAVFGVNKAGL